MNPQLKALLDQVRQNPGNGRVLADLTRAYVSPQVTPADRTMIQTALAGDPRATLAVHQWGAAVPDDDPQRYIRLRLLVHALTDGQPDLYEAGLEIERTMKWAHRRGIDPTPHIEAVQHIASPKIANLLQQRLLAWKRTRDFVDQQIAALLDTLKQQPNDRAALEALAAMYIHPDTTEEQRRSMRHLTQSRPALIENYNHWMPDHRDEVPDRFLRLMLGAISLVDAQPDARLAARRVFELCAFARQHGLDPDEAIEEICAISLPRAEQVLRVR